MKHTQGEWELQYVSGVCIGIGVQQEDNYYKIISNTVLPDSDEEYLEEKDEIEANTKLMASAPKLLKALKALQKNLNEEITTEEDAEALWNIAHLAIKEATS